MRPPDARRAPHADYLRGVFDHRPPYAHDGGLAPPERPASAPPAPGRTPVERRALARAALRDALGTAALVALAAAAPLLAAATRPGQ